MGKKKPLLKRMPLNQMIAAAAAAISVIFLLAFGGQIIEIYRLRSALAVADRGLDELRTEQAALEATLAYVQTDEYVEQIARAELNKVRPGDHRIVVITREAPPATPVPTPAPPPAPDAPPYFSAWRDLLFGS